MKTNMNIPLSSGPVVGKLYKANKILGSSNGNTGVIIKKNTVIMLVEIFTPSDPFTLLEYNLLHGGSVVTRYYNNIDKYSVIASWNEDFALCNI